MPGLVTFEPCGSSQTGSKSRELSFYGMWFCNSRHASNESNDDDDAFLTLFRGEWWKEAGYSFQPTFGSEAPVANPFQSESCELQSQIFLNRSNSFCLNVTFLFGIAYLILHSRPSFFLCTGVQGEVACPQTFFFKEFQFLLLLQKVAPRVAKQSKGHLMVLTL